MPNSIHDILREKIEYVKHVEKTLAAKLGLEELSTGCHVIRNERGWRENEKYIDYIWIVHVSRSFVGHSCLFSVKFGETHFRKYFNKAEFIEGFFINVSNAKGHLYTNTADDTVFDIKHFNKLDLFDANRGIALDGVGYDIRIIAPNIDTRISVENPNSKEWIKWEKGIWKVGRKFGEDTDHPGMIQLFT
jgi:hypothetical protein